MFNESQKSPVRLAIAVNAAHLLDLGRSSNSRWFRHYHHPTISALLDRFPNSFIAAVAEGEDCIWSIANILNNSPDVVFNLANKPGPWESQFVGALESLGQNFTGASSTAIYLCNDKTLSKQLLQMNGVEVPLGFTVECGASIGDMISAAMIVKPAIWGGASWGICAGSVVKTRVQLEKQVRRIWSKYGTPALCEQFIVGDDLRVAVFRTRSGAIRVFGSLRWKIPTIQPGWGFRTEAIRSSDYARERAGVIATSVRQTTKLKSTLRELTKRSLDALQVSGPVTLDFRIRADETPCLLEVNANPGLSALSPIWNGSFEAVASDMVREALHGNEVKAVRHTAAELRSMLQLEN